MLHQGSYSMERYLLVAKPEKRFKIQVRTAANLTLTSTLGNQTTFTALPQFIPNITSQDCGIWSNRYGRKAPIKFGNPLIVENEFQNFAFRGWTEFTIRIQQFTVDRRIRLNVQGQSELEPELYAEVRVYVSVVGQPPHKATLHQTSRCLTTDRVTPIHEWISCLPRPTNGKPVEVMVGCGRIYTLKLQDPSRQYQFFWIPGSIWIPLLSSTPGELLESLMIFASKRSAVYLSLHTDLPTTKTNSNRSH